MKILSLVLVLWASLASAQPLEIRGTTETEAANAMPKLAEATIGRLQEPVQETAGRDPFLDTLFRLQLVAKQYEAAIASIHELRALRQAGGAKPGNLLFAQYETVARAKLGQAAGRPVDAAFQDAAREVLAPLDDWTANRTLLSFRGDLDRMRETWLRLLEEQTGKLDPPLEETVALIRAFQVQQAYQLLNPRAEAVTAADDARRYAIDKDILIRTPDGASISTIVVRPRSADPETAKAKPLPTLLGFTVYANDEWSLHDARTMAAHGYAGVVAYTRGKGRSPDLPVPYEHDGDDARAVIAWIARQPWSDQRVGMYGGSYNGFTQWAAAKRLPRELKALMTSATAAPGIDIPMQGNVFLNFLYPWIPYVTNVKALDDETYSDTARWESLNRNWYVGGKAYRDLDRIDGHPSPMFRKWLDHPSYDAYWQAMIPYREEFAAINIPVFATTGYFDGAQVGVLYYFQQHNRYNPKADHTLLIGPYEHLTMQAGVPPVVQGYEVDPVAKIDLQELRLQWFDFIFKGAEKPALLKDKVNYQVLGANEWKHAPSLEAMANGSLNLHLGPANRLTAEPPSPDAVTLQTVDFVDRSDAGYKPAELSVTKTLDAHNGIAFVGDVIVEPTEISGLFSGKLDFQVNKKDFDYTVTLYEKMASGDYLLLAYHLGRASYAKDRTRRELLKVGERQQLTFKAERIVGRKLEPGSQLVVVLGIVKQPDSQINYGTGKDVSDETIQDAGDPLRIEWYGDSVVEIPVWR